MKGDLAQVGRLVREALDRGAVVEIDGLGVFRPLRDGGYEFAKHTAPRVFVGYAHEDAEHAERLCDKLSDLGFDPWLDRRKLLPGQNWPRAIEYAIDTSEFAILCFSSRSVRKKGGFQAEIRYVLECARRMPLDEVFLVPVRLDDCPMPLRITREIQYIDLFPDWTAGLRSVLRVLRRRGRRPRAA